VETITVPDADRFSFNLEDVPLLGIFPGQPAPVFTAQTLDGQTLRLADLRGKTVLIDFWATWCAPCVAELPNIRKLHETYADDGLVIIGVSFDRDAATAHRYVEQKGLGWRQIWADGAHEGPLAKQYHVRAIPATYLIGPDGKVIARDLRGDDLAAKVRESLGVNGPEDQSTGILDWLRK
jgi:peroxiredoxin